MPTTGEHTENGQRADVSENPRLRSWRYDGYSIHQVGANAGGEAFLLCTDDGATALFDTGFAFCAKQTLDNIYAVTDGRDVDLIILTHSHYDHCAATGYLVQAMPQAKVAASAYAAYVFTRPGAYKTMDTLDSGRAQEQGYTDYPRIEPQISVDTVLEEGDTFCVGPLTFEAMSAVGHTKCCMAFWCAEEGLFVSSETSGVVCLPVPVGMDVPDDVPYLVDFIELVGFASAMEHIERVRRLPIRVFLATHHGCIDGPDVRAMWRSVDYWRTYIQDLVMGMHRQGCSVEEISAAYKQIFYWGGTAPFQPEAAFDLNISYAIPAIIRDCE